MHRDQKKHGFLLCSFNAGSSDFFLGSTKNIANGKCKKKKQNLAIRNTTKLRSITGNMSLCLDECQVGIIQKWAFYLPKQTIVNKRESIYRIDGNLSQIYRDLYDFNKIFILFLMKTRKMMEYSEDNHVRFFMLRQYWKLTLIYT